MRLLTHNMLAANIKGTSYGYPLKIEVFVKEERATVFHRAFLLNVLPKIHWTSFWSAAECLGVHDLPKAVPSNPELDETFLRKFHHALLEIHVKEGYLICPDSGRRFPITKGIPNMLLNEDEIT
mmetsp:Transcript_11560/g.52287  ORF Transcript_11560/g.52287 Transcript_11560/m.52287 type:complete len:124 (+) Transcript_11560:176-547(+)